MKVNRIIALRLMLSVAVIGFASCSKIKFKSASRAGWNVDSKKASGNKKQVAGPGLILWREL
jgi:hypothetical protein